MDGSRFPLQGRLFFTKPQLEMDCCVSTSIESVVATIVATTVTTSIITTTTFGWNFFNHKNSNNILGFVEEKSRFLETQKS